MGTFSVWFLHLGEIWICGLMVKGGQGQKDLNFLHFGFVVFFPYLSSFQNVVILWSTRASLDFMNIYGEGVFVNIGKITPYGKNSKLSAKNLSSFKENLQC